MVLTSSLGKSLHVESFKVKQLIAYRDSYSAEVCKVKVSKSNRSSDSIVALSCDSLTPRAKALSKAVMRVSGWNPEV